MALVIAAVLLAMLLIIALVLNGRRAVDDSSMRLPAGADAALWSIVEVVPDPRNHLALTRDLTGEVRISGTILDPEVKIATLLPPPPPAPAGGSSVRIITAAEMEREDAAAAAAASTESDDLHRAS